MRKTYVTAGTIAAAAALWVGSGLFTGQAKISDASMAAEANAEADLVTVRARTLNAQQRRSDIVVRGRTQALRRVNLRAEAEGRVVDVPAQKGSTVQEGDIICRLAMNDREARRSEANTVLRQRELEHQAATALSAKGYRAETQLAGAKARLDSARASLASIETEIENTIIRAPFDGIVEERPAEIGHYLQKGGSCAVVVDSDPFLVVGQISERDVGKITVNARGTAQLITGQTVEGNIRYISSTADPATRTFRVELEIPNKSGTLRDGITAEIRLPVAEITAHLISPSLLTLNHAGIVGVRTVSSDGIVAFRPVELMGDSEEGVWVTGLADTAKLITVGNEFVKEGQRVAVTLDEEGIAE